MIRELTIKWDEIEHLNEIYARENLGRIEDTIPFLDRENKKRAEAYHPCKGCYIGGEGWFQPIISIFKELEGKNEMDMGYMGLDENPSIIEDENGDWIPNPDYLDQYGVCDDVQQVLDKYGERLENDGHEYFIWFAPVFQDKSNAGKGGGWRWHKWGEYIGNLNPQYEYLDDEDFGEDWQGYVLCWHIYRIDAKKTKIIHK